MVFHLFITIMHFCYAISKEHQQQGKHLLVNLGILKLHCLVPCLGTFVSHVSDVCSLECQNGNDDIENTYLFCHLIIETTMVTLWNFYRGIFWWTFPTNKYPCHSSCHNSINCRQDWTIIMLMLKFLRSDRIKLGKQWCTE